MIEINLSLFILALHSLIIFNILFLSSFPVSLSVIFLSKFNLFFELILSFPSSKFILLVLLLFLDFLIDLL